MARALSRTVRFATSAVTVAPEMLSTSIGLASTTAPPRRAVRRGRIAGCERVELLHGDPTSKIGSAVVDDVRPGDHACLAQADERHERLGPSRRRCAHVGRHHDPADQLVRGVAPFDERLALDVLEVERPPGKTESQSMSPASGSSAASRTRGAWGRTLTVLCACRRRERGALR